MRINNIIGLLLILSLLGCSGFEHKVIEDLKTDTSNYNALIETINNCDFSRFSNDQYIGNEYFPKRMKDAINKTVLNNKVEYLLMRKD